MRQIGGPFFRIFVCVILTSVLACSISTGFIPVTQTEETTSTLERQHSPTATDPTPTFSPSPTERPPLQLEFYSQPPDDNTIPFWNYLHSLLPEIEVHFVWEPQECFPYCPHGTSLLEKRILEGRPPDAFSISLGYDFNNHWIPSGYVRPLEDILGWDYEMENAPSDYLDWVSYNGHLWAVPVAIEVINILWYNETLLEENDIQAKDLTTFEGWEAAAKKLKAAGIIPMAMYDSRGETWHDGKLFGNVLAGSMSPEAYLGLWTGKTNWKGPEVALALKHLRMMMQYVNADHAELSDYWEAEALFQEGKAAMMIEPGWSNGTISIGSTSPFRWTTSPGTEGVFVYMNWGFASPIGAKNPEAVEKLFRVLASKEGSEVFLENLAGGLCVRNDCEYHDEDGFRQSMAPQLLENTLLPCFLWDAASDFDWSNAIHNAVAEYLRTWNISSTQAKLEQACKDAGPCQ